MSELIFQVSQYIEKENLLKKNSTVIVGLSGGPDSVCLLTILNELKEAYGIKLIAAHVDYGWRSSSADDAEFCRTFCNNLDIPFHAIKAQDRQLTKKYNGSIEEQARQIRRQFFQELAETYGAEHIALAHHQDDQIETFFIRLLRGSSVAGLASMRPIHGKYIRPLLALPKKNILLHLALKGYAYCTDETNDNEALLRNALRKNIIPALKLVDERFTQSCLKAIEHLQDTDSYLKKQTDELFFDITGALNELDYQKFLEIDSFIQHAILIKWLCAAHVPFTPTSSFLSEITRFLSGRAKSHVLGSWRIEKNHTKAFIKNEQ